MMGLPILLIVATVVQYALLAYAGRPWPGPMRYLALLVIPILLGAISTWIWFGANLCTPDNADGCVTQFGVGTTLNLLSGLAVLSGLMAAIIDHYRAKP